MLNSYDAILYEKKRRLSSLILNGSKITVMTVDNVTFLKNLCYSPIPLLNLYKAFGFRNAAVKGFFPHLLNIPDNSNYICDMSLMEYYSPDTMFSKSCEEFIK